MSTGYVRYINKVIIIIKIINSAMVMDRIKFTEPNVSSKMWNKIQNPRVL